MLSQHYTHLCSFCCRRVTLLTQRLDFGMKVEELLIQHGAVDSHDLLLRRESDIDYVESREQSVRNGVSATSRWPHGGHQLHFMYVLSRLFTTVVPVVFKRFILFIHSPRRL